MGKCEMGNGALRILLMLSAALTVSTPSVAQQEPLGRLFFTPAQRSSLDVARSQRARTTLSTEVTEEQQAAPQAQTITYGGMVRRSDGKSTVWINGRPVNEEQAASGPTVVGRVRNDGSISVQVPQSGRNIELKPGQSLELLSGTIEESYTRKPAQPEVKPVAKPPTKPAAEASPAEKPVPAEVAAAERDKEEQQRKIEEALRALQEAAKSPPAAGSPGASGPAK
jgi:hypothetical protein